MKLPGSLRVDAAGRRCLFITRSSALVELDDISNAAFELLEAAPDDGDLPTPAVIVEKLVGRFPDLEKRNIAKSVSDLARSGALDGMIEVANAKGDLEAVKEAKPVPETVPPADMLPRTKTVVLNVVQLCNLACNYCYATDGTYGDAGFMSTKVAQDSVEFLFREAKDADNLQVTLFGGEPLMNYTLIKEVVDYVEKRAAQLGKKAGFSVTSNATLLDEEKVRFLNEHGIGIQLSIDGPKDVHDAQRPFGNGSGESSYDAVRRGIDALFDHYTVKHVAARVTLTRLNTDIIRTFYHLRDDVGFTEVGFGPASTLERRLDLATPELMGVFDKFQELGRHYIEEAARGDYHGFSNLSNVLQIIQSGDVKTHACGAGYGMTGVGTDGTLYPCHRFVGMKGFEIGDVENGYDNDARFKFLHEGAASSKTPCQVCWAQGLCGGSCHYDNVLYTGEMTVPFEDHCNAIRKWLGYGLQAYVELMDRSPEFFDKVLAGPRPIHRRPEKPYEDRWNTPPVEGEMSPSTSGALIV